MTESIAQRLVRIRQQIEDERRHDDVVLVAITKTVSPERVLEAYYAGQRFFGENRVQEARPKIDALRTPAPDAKWHLVGHLQTNKANAAGQYFDMIESVDSLRLAERINAVAGGLGIILPILLEVNVAGEKTKAGYRIEDLRSAVDRMADLPNVLLAGLMTVAPLSPDPEDVRWVFRDMRRTRDEIRQEKSLAAFRHLSMGMSNDFTVALQEGATIVRLGRSIFGDRPSIK